MPQGPEVIHAAVSLGEVAAGTEITLTASADDSRYDSNGYGNEPVQTISEARYSVDAPPWAADVVFYPIQAADGNFNSSVENMTATLDTAGWASGRHTVYLQAQDSLGNWGVPSALFLTVTKPAYALSMDKPPMLFAAPGVTLDQPLTLHNLGDVSDSYTVTVSGEPTWLPTLPASVGPVAAGDTTQVRLAVTPPMTVTEEETQRFTVTATSMGNPSIAFSLPVSIMAQVVHGLEVLPITNSITSRPGRAVTVTVRVKNVGNVTDTAELTYSTTTEQSAWPISLPYDPHTRAGRGGRASRDLSIPRPRPKATIPARIPHLPCRAAETLNLSWASTYSWSGSMPFSQSFLDRSVFGP